MPCSRKKKLEEGGTSASGDTGSQFPPQAYRQCERMNKTDVGHVTSHTKGGPPRVLPRPPSVSQADYLRQQQGLWSTAHLLAKAVPTTGPIGKGCRPTDSRCPSNGWRAHLVARVTRTRSPDSGIGLVRQLLSLLSKGWKILASITIGTAPLLRAGPRTAPSSEQPE